MSKDGGPAFPGKVCTGHVDETPVYEHPKGMSLRDYFAAAALTGLLSTSKRWNMYPHKPTTDKKKKPVISSAQYVDLSYRMADAMLTERDK